MDVLYFKNRCAAAVVLPTATDEIEGGMLTGRTLRCVGSGERDFLLRSKGANPVRSCYFD